MIVLLSALLIACTGTTELPAEPPVGTAAPVAPVAPPSPTPAPAPEPPADGIPTLAGAEHSEAWWVILSSKKEPGVPVPGVEALKSRSDVRLGRLQSSQFKGLMPCYEVVVAGTFAKKDEALALSAELKKTGLDHYVKNAGKFVGESEQLDAWCSAQLADAGAGHPSRWPTWGVDRAHVVLDVPADVAERLVAQAGKPKRLDDELFVAELNLEEAGAYKKGEAWRTGKLGDDGGVQDCVLDRFAVAWQGTPHFGWMEGDKSSPGCGEPELVGVLKCSETGGDVAWPLSRPVASLKTVEIGHDLEPLAMNALRKNAVYATARAEAETHGGEVKEEIVFNGWTDGKTLYVTASTKITTGEGYDLCGGEDFVAMVSGMIDSEGKVVVPFTAGSAYELKGVVVEDGQPQMVGEQFPNTRLIRGATADFTESRDYCDCPC